MKTMGQAFKEQYNIIVPKYDADLKCHRIEDRGLYYAGFCNPDNMYPHIFIKKGVIAMDAMLSIIEECGFNYSYSMNWGNLRTEYRSIRIFSADEFPKNSIVYAWLKNTDSRISYTSTKAEVHNQHETKYHKGWPYQVEKVYNYNNITIETGYGDNIKKRPLTTKERELLSTLL